MSIKKLVLWTGFFLIMHQFFAFVYLILAFSFSALTGRVDLADDAAFTELLSSQSAMATLLAGAASLILYAWLFRKESFVSFYRLQRPSAKVALISFILGISAPYLSGYVIVVVDVLFPEALANYIEMFESFTLGNPVVAFLAIVLMAPLFEEVLFRGVLFRLFERSRVKLLTTMILTSLLFGAFHLNIVQGSFASVLGFVIALAYVWTGTLWVPIIIHFANNLWSFINGLEPVAEFFESQELLTGAISIVAVFVIIPGALYVLFKDRTPIDYHPALDVDPQPKERLNDPFA
jgi:membrane protease YdiL (CAAX protease family)